MGQSNNQKLSRSFLELLEQKNSSITKRRQQVVNSASYKDQNNMMDHEDYEKIDWFQGKFQFQSALEADAKFCKQMHHQQKEQKLSDKPHVVNTFPKIKASLQQQYLDDDQFNFVYAEQNYRSSLQFIRYSQKTLQFQSSSSQNLTQSVQYMIQQQVSIQQCVASIMNQFQDQFVPKKFKRCCDQILKEPKLYEKTLQGYLGLKSQELPIIQRKFRQNNFFNEFVKQCSITAIHQLPKFRKLIYIDKSNLFYFKLNAKEWVFEKLSKQIEEKQTQYINNILEQCKKKPQSHEIFFVKVYGYLIDFINRKLNLLQLIKLIQSIVLANGEINPGLKKILVQLTCMDLLVIISKMSMNKASFGMLLNQSALPIPVIFKTLSKQGQITYLQLNLLEQILRSKDYQIVVNFGSKEMIDRGKTTFIKQMYTLKKQQRYFSNQNCKFHAGAVHVYTQIPIKHQKKQLLIFDFQASYDQKSQSKQYVQFFKIILRKAMVVYYHINYKQLPIKIHNVPNHQNSPIYKKLRCCPGKVFIVKRDCEKMEPDHLYDTFQVICIPKLANDQHPEMKNKKKTIFQKIQSFKWLAQRLTITKFINQSTYQKGEKKIDQIVEIMQGQDIQENRYQSMFPKLHSIWKLQEIKKDQDDVRYKYAHGLQNNLHKKKKQLYSSELQLKEKSQKIKPSKLVQKVTQVVKQFLQKKDYNIFEELAHEINVWKTKSIGHLLNERDNIKNKLDKQDHTELKRKLQKMILQCEQKIQSLDISLETVFSQIIALDKTMANQLGNYEIIEKYYKNSLKNLKEVNLVEGKTLSFGNKHLSKLLKEYGQLKKNKNKPIFVISVIGIQSSAKSTLMNYLFKCSFTTSAGRCTKGVYFTLVESEQKLIVVIDTEGLKSLSKRDQMFDIQISSFVMLISDLVIVNCKNQVNHNEGDLLGVCLYALNELNRRDEKHHVQYKPNHVIFTIRNQVDDGISTQKGMLSEIINFLKQNSEIDYENFLKFSSNDIFPVQSAFFKQNYQQVNIIEENQCFGKAILAMRSKVMEKLTSCRYSSLEQFYSEAEHFWNAIKNCGRNIFNFKDILEIRTKNDIEIRMKSILEDFKDNYNQRQGRIIKNYSKSLVQDRNKIEADLDLLFQTVYSEVIFEFQRRCQDVRKKQLVNCFYPTIRAQLIRLHRIFHNSAQIKINLVKKQEKKQQFERRLKMIFSQRYDKKNSQDVLLFIKQMEGQFNKQLQKNSNIDKLLNEMQQKHSPNVLMIQQECQRFLTNQYKLTGISGISYSKLLQNQKIIFQNSNDDDLVEIFGTYKSRPIWSLQNQKIQQIRKCILCINQRIRNKLQNNNFFIIERVQSILSELKVIIYEQYQQMKQHLNNEEDFELKPKAQFLGIFIVGFPKPIHERMLLNQIEEEKKSFQELQKILNVKIEYIRRFLESEGKKQKIGNIWIEKIIESSLQRAKNQSQLSLQNSLSTVQISLDPPKMIEKAMNLSINCQDISSKQRMINCFKLVTNINRFIRELMRKQSEIKGLNEDISKQINKVIQTCKKQLEETFVKITQDVKSYSQNTIDYYAKRYRIDLSIEKDILSEVKLHCVIEQLQRKLSQNRLKFHQQIQERARRQISEKLKYQTERYIQDIISPRIVGCQARCPFCGIKCKKNCDHSDGHEAIASTHLILCFKGYFNEKNNRRSNELCYSKNMIDRNNLVVSKGNTKNYVDVVPWLQRYNPRWLDHFKLVSDQGLQRRQECEFVWQNIGQMLLKYTFKARRVINDHRGGKFELTQQDMEKYDLKYYKFDKK